MSDLGPALYRASRTHGHSFGDDWMRVNMKCPHCHMMDVRRAPATGGLWCFACGQSLRDAVTHIVEKVDESQ